MINADLDYVHLDKELDRVKTRVFLGNNAAFLGSIMCSMNFMWTSDIKTAQTNGVSLQWNPYWFLKIPFETRVTVLVHELWHVALLHMLRRGERDPKTWNYACDIAINNMLQIEGYTLKALILGWIRNTAPNLLRRFSMIFSVCLSSLSMASISGAMKMKMGSVIPKILLNQRKRTPTGRGFSHHQQRGPCQSCRQDVW